MADKFQLKALITGVDKLSPMLTGVRKNAAQLRKQLNGSGLGEINFGDVLQGGAMAAPFVMGARAAMGFETAMADVKKVVDFETPAQFAQMSDDVLDLSEQLPMAAEGIAAIVAAGGQAGIAREELRAFAEDAVKMGVAFDQTAEQSGETMAKWRTAFKLTQDGVVELADQINYLGNTGPANAQQISAMVTSIGPLGEIAGLTSAQIAAMGATLAGMGVAQDVAATGMKNFMLTLTAGTAASKAQQRAFKALRLDAAQIAKGMQDDAEGTINRVLKAVSKVDKAKQAAVLTQLFGRESVGAVAPLLTNLDLLQGNFAKVGDATQYAGSMQAEYAARAATTQNNLQLLQNRVVRLGISVGAALLPPFNDFMATMGPVISGVSELAAANPWLVKGILGAAVGFGVLRVAVMASTAALAVMNTVAGMSPVGLVVRGIALAAGFLIANWGTVGPWFAELWEGIKGVALAGWELLKQVAGFTPLGWIIENWEPLQGFFVALWDFTRALFATGFDYLKSAFEWTPLGLIIKHWEPIVGWFQELWARIKPYIDPLLNAGQWLGDTVGDFFGPGQDATGGAVRGATATLNGWTQQLDGAGRPGAAVRKGFVSRSGATDAASLAAQVAASSRTDLQGALVVRFENAPQGLRAEPAQTNQPGLSVTPQVGYRSLSRG